MLQSRLLQFLAFTGNPAGLQIMFMLTDNVSFQHHYLSKRYFSGTVEFHGNIGVRVAENSAMESAEFMARESSWIGAQEGRAARGAATVVICHGRR